MEKYFIPSESGEAINVTKDEYMEWLEKNQGKIAQAPKFQTPEQKEARKNVIDETIEMLNQEELTSDEMYKIEDKVVIKTEEDIEKENRERLDDDIQGFQTSQQQEALDGKDAKIQSITEYLNSLNLKEDELKRIESEVKRYDNKENTEDKSKEEKENNAR